jgi:serine/threonine protein kinase
MRQIGRYRLDAVQGSGSFATVWRGHDTELDVPVAVKVLAENWAHHADVRERFLQEARLLRRIESPRVVRVHDVGVEDERDGGRPYFVMDFAAGGSLEPVADGSLEQAEALRLCIEACRAVQVLHEAGVVHRDVKPANLLVAEDGRVLVADLGSVKHLAEASGWTVTTGTPAYMAPEQVSGGRIDARTDVFALGVLTHVMLTGALPTDPGRHELGPASSAVAKALSPDPARRQAGADALADDLQRAAAGDTDVSGWPVWVVVPLAVVLFVVAAAGAWLGLR